MAQGAPGTGIYTALEDLLTTRKADKLKKQEIAQKLAQQAFENKLAERASSLQERQFGAQQQQAQERSADVLSSRLSPGQALQAPDIASLQAGGRGGFIQGPPSLNGIPQFTGTLEQNQQEGAPQSRFTGTFDQRKVQEAAQAAAEERAMQRTFLGQQGAENRAAANQRASEANQTRQDIAGLNSGNRAIANELTMARIASERDKLATAQETRKAAETSKAQTRTEISSLAEELQGDPQKQQAVGALSGRLPSLSGKTRDFDNRVSRLKSLLSLENRAKLKGSGAISDFEAKMLEHAATALDQGTDVASFDKALGLITSAVGGSASAPAAGTKEALRAKYGY